MLPSGLSIARADASSVNVTHQNLVLAHPSYYTKLVSHQDTPRFKCVFVSVD